MFFIHLFPNWSCHNFVYGGHGEFSSCQEFFSSRSRRICTAVPEMKAVISADIILERRNTVVYYSPLIKSVRLSSLPPPSPSLYPLATSHPPLVNFLHHPSYMFFFALPLFPSLPPSIFFLPVWFNKRTAPERALTLSVRLCGKA